MTQRRQLVGWRYPAALMALTAFQAGSSALDGQQMPSALQNQQPASYRVPLRDSSAMIPFTMNGGHMVLEVGINGKRLDLVLDNGNVGAPTFLYGSPKIDSIGLSYSGEALVGGAGDGEMPAAKVARDVTIELARATILSQTVVVMGYDPRLLKAFEGEDGVIGGAIWDNYVVRIDFDRKVVVLTMPHEFTYAGTGNELTLGYRPDGGSTLPGTMRLSNGTLVSALFHLDLGSSAPLSVNLESQPNIVKPRKTIERRAFGSQGEFVEHVGRISYLQLGGFVINDVLTAFTSTRSLSAMGNEGAIGNGVFQRFNVTFDYANDRVFLEPNSHFSDPFEFNMSGLGLMRADDGNYTIALILPDSPASEVDLEIGDVVEQISGQPSAAIGRDELTQMLKEEGKILSLTVIRDGKQRTVSLRLRRLI